MPTLLPPKLVATSPVSCDQGKDGCARSAGLLWSPPEVETDVLKLWVAQDTRLQHELGFYEEHFSRPRAARILFTPQPGKSLLTSCSENGDAQQHRFGRWVDFGK